MGARGLVDLPTEVRLNIYSCLLPRSVIVPFTGAGLSKMRKGSLKIALKAVLALLQVHSTCYKDIIVPLYALNTFVLLSATDAAHWIKMIGRQNAALIQTIQLRWAEGCRVEERRRQAKDYISVLPHLSAIRSIMFVGLGPFLLICGDGLYYWKRDALEFAKGIVRRMPWLAKVYRSSDPSYPETCVWFAAGNHTYTKFVSFRHYGARRQRLSKN
jgi:hypothetical protein